MPSETEVTEFMPIPDTPEEAVRFMSYVHAAWAVR
jgi:hypothetical protein